MNWIYISREKFENENIYIIITSFMRNYLSTGYGQGKSRIIRSYYIYNNPSIQLIGSLHTISPTLIFFTTPHRVVKRVLSLFLVLGQVQP